jgi:hypothetical protein
MLLGAFNLEDKEARGKFVPGAFFAVPVAYLDEPCDFAGILC